MNASIKIHIPRDVAHDAGFPLHGDTNYEPSAEELAALDPSLATHLVQFSERNINTQRLRLGPLDRDAKASELLWPAIVRALVAHVHQLTDTQRNGVQVLEQWARHQSLWPELKRSVTEGYAVAAHYIALVSVLVSEHHLQITPAPESTMMPRPVFQADYLTELRPAPSMYAFTVRDRLVAACAKLRGELAKGTELAVSQVLRCTPRNKDSTEKPFTAVVVEVMHPGAPEPACVVFTAEARTKP